MLNTTETIKMKLILFFAVVIITTPYCSTIAIEETTNDISKREVATTTTTDSSQDYKLTIQDIEVEVLKGRDGRDGQAGPQGVKGDKGEPGKAGPAGLQGQKGERGPAGQEGKKGADGHQGSKGEQGPKGETGSSGGGAVYTRWGRTVCPNTNGTELVYKGLTAGSYYISVGGGANYLCITEDPKYLTNNIPGAYSDIGGTEYEHFISSPSLHNHNVPCAVCHTSQRSSKLMIPGTISCPQSWTEEYTGYLMSAYHTHKRTIFECVDKDAEPVPGEGHGNDGAQFFHNAANCNVGLPCPPFVAKRPITCVVCTK